MQLKDLKRALIKRAITVSVVLCGILFVVYTLNQQVVQSEEKYHWLKGSISSLNTKLDGLNKKTLEFSEAVGQWEHMTADQKLLTGLQITKANELIKRFETEFRLMDVKVTFSKPEELKEGITSDTVKVVNSVVNIDFRAENDEYALQFVEALQKQFPGYVQITSFSLSRNEVVTKDVLSKIAKGENVALVSGIIELTWKELKYSPNREEVKDS